MLASPDTFQLAGLLPDVARSVAVPGQQQSASALAGINSGRDYAAAIYAATQRPLIRERKQLDELDRAPESVEEKKVRTAKEEKQRVSLNLRRGMAPKPGPYSPPSQIPPGGYAQPVYPEDANGVLPSEPVAPPTDDGNILIPPGGPDGSFLFPVPPPLTPPATPLSGLSLDFHP